ncbi:hypothetical protein ACG04Q_11960 [Roseateles sp. DXS20W]|uniref:Uncharacterized protein n=1 Tax=Pelomonas lactea TaxID=3299030 RepID=A0ABW7GK42_9BURK
MNVQQLREQLAELPGHWPVHVEVEKDGSGGGGDVDFHFALDVQPSSFPTYGSMAVIRIARPEDLG